MSQYFTDPSICSYWLVSLTISPILHVVVVVARLKSSCEYLRGSDYQSHRNDLIAHSLVIKIRILPVELSLPGACVPGFIYRWSKQILAHFRPVGTQREMMEMRV